jgi:hypothetical protein
MILESDIKFTVSMIETEFTLVSEACRNPSFLLAQFNDTRAQLQAFEKLPLTPDFKKYLDNRILQLGIYCDKCLLSIRQNSVIHSSGVGLPPVLPLDFTL